MGLFEKLFPRPGAAKAAAAGKLFETLTAYKPVFRSWGGQMYESELIRACVDAYARHISKLHPFFTGSAKGKLKTQMQVAPNEWQTWSQFLYRLASIQRVYNNAFVVPVLDDFGDITGYYPVLPLNCELVDVGGAAWLRYSFANGKKAAIEMSKCALITRHQLRDDIFGEANTALNDTMNLLTVQRQGIEEGIKNSATFRFMAKLSNFAKPEDLAKERLRFNKENLQGESGGILLFPNTYTDISQIKSEPYLVDAAQLEMIQTNVFNYFGCNQDIIQGKAIGDALDAYFDSEIEPFMIQCSEAMTRMTFSGREIAQGNAFKLDANRLQYMSTANKVSMAKEMGDRGILMIDEIRELFNYAPLPDGKGQHCPIRGEYYMVDEGKEPKEPPKDPPKDEDKPKEGEDDGDEA